MPRQKHIIHTVCPYHVTARSHDGVWFHLPLAVVWNIMSDYLYMIQKAYDVQIHSFVLMSNHFHLIISTPRGNLSEAMNYFMRETSKEMNRMSGRKNQVYGNRFFRSLITKDHHYRHVYKYVYRNPVTAGVSKCCASYEFSTLCGLLGRRKLLIPLADDKVLFDKGREQEVIDWLNLAPKNIDYAILKKALQRRTLKLPKNTWVAARHTLEFMPL